MKKIIFFLLLSSILIAQNTNSFVDAIKSINNLKVREFLKNGADPNIAQPGKETPLMEAARNGKKELVTMLLAKGAKTNLKNNWDETAQYLAQQNGHKEIVEILKRAGSKNK